MEQPTRRTLQAEDVDALHARYVEHRSPDVAAELIRRHEGLAGSLATRFVGRGESVDDLRQVALVGLVLALDRFDPSRGLKFSTFAVPTMLGELKRHFRDRSWLVKPPRPLQERYLQVQSVVDGLTQELGRPAAVAEVAAHLGITVEHVVEALEVGGVRRPVVSLDDEVGDGASITFLDVLAKEDWGHTSAEDRLFVDALLRSLPDSEREVLVLFFFGNLSQRDVGLRLGQSQMTVSRTKQRALQRLRSRVTAAA